MCAVPCRSEFIQLVYNATEWSVFMYTAEETLLGQARKERHACWSGNSTAMGSHVCCAHVTPPTDIGGISSSARVHHDDAKEARHSNCYGKKAHDEQRCHAKNKKRNCANEHVRSRVARPIQNHTTQLTPSTTKLPEETKRIHMCSPQLLLDLLRRHLRI